jgi:hypothetical protein
VVRQVSGARARAERAARDDTLARLGAVWALVEIEKTKEGWAFWFEDGTYDGPGNHYVVYTRTTKGASSVASPASEAARG